MTAFVDTNVLIRHLTGDPPEMAARATAYLSQTDELVLADLVVAEVVYVLESFYEAPRGRVAALLEAVVSAPQMRVQDRPVLLRALEVYETNRLDFAEAYLVASAERADIDAVVSFDRAIDRVGTVTHIEP